MVNLETARLGSESGTLGSDPGVPATIGGTPGSDPSVPTGPDAPFRTKDKHQGAFFHWLKVQVKSFVFHTWLPWRYRKAARQAVQDNRVLFVELSRGELSNNLQCMWNEMQSRGMDCCFVSLGSFRQAMPAYFRNCTAFMQELARAHYVFICESIEAISCVELRPETCVANLWHGPGAFKRFGMSTAEKVFGGDRAEKERFPQNRNNALVSISSPEVKWAYVEALALEGSEDVVQPYGTSRTDVFFDPAFLHLARQAVHDAVPKIGARKAVLYAPTFRGRVSFASAPDALDLGAMAQALGEEYVLLVKHHPHVKKLSAIPAAAADFAFDVTERLPIEYLLAVADICVTDYSSLVFEYALFGRPLAFFAYDLQDYDDWRGFYYTYDDFVPGPIVRNTEELIDFLLHVEDRFDADAVERFKQKFMSACDGQATKRIADAVLGGTLPSLAPITGPVDAASGHSSGE